ncbi:MAG TPA: type II toxin-antitoxin system PemK/MazF family toxin [Chloroflexota bacterium]|jgi:mRNA interferase MazF
MSVPGTFPRRGDVYWIDFGAPRGGEIGKTRPSVIVSNDTSNRHSNRVQVVPLTSNTHRVYPSEALVHLSGRPSKAMADQIATAAKERLGNYIATLSAEDMYDVERAIVVQLDLNGLR